MSQIALLERKNECVILVMKPERKTPLSRPKMKIILKGISNKYCVKV